MHHRDGRRIPVSVQRVGRWQGEEFVAIIRNVTLSIGASLIMPFDTVESLFVRSDALLYESKTMGRDRLTIG